MRLMRQRPLSEIRRPADSETKRVGGQARPEQEVSPEDGGAWGGWRRNVWKCTLGNQGYLPWCWKEQGAGVRVPIVAMKRVTTVEPRGAGRWKHDRNTTARTTAASAT